MWDHINCVSIGKHVKITLEHLKDEIISGMGAGGGCGGGGVCFGLGFLRIHEVQKRSKKTTNYENTALGK